MALSYGPATPLASDLQTSRALLAAEGQHPLYRTTMSRLTIPAGNSSARTAVVTGAGSGVGRAVAVALLERGWRVALVGRREEPLRETAALADGEPGRAEICPCDIANAMKVSAVAADVLEQFGSSVAVLVNAAGTNLPERRLDQLTPDAWRTIVAANLDGAFYLVHAFLPAMRRAGQGTIVNVNSLAGLRASALSGASYSASKFGLAGLTQSINAEENANGIRATGVYPGDINTPLLEKRPSVPTPEARARMLQPEDVTACVLLAIDLPARAVVEEIVVRPRV